MISVITLTTLTYKNTVDADNKLRYNSDNVITVITMANPIFAFRVPDEDLQAFRDLCTRYGVDAGEVVKRFMSDCVKRQSLEITGGDSEPSLTQRVARLEERFEALEKEKKHGAIAA